MYGVVPWNLAHGTAVVTAVAGAGAAVPDLGPLASTAFDLFHKGKYYIMLTLG